MKTIDLTKENNFVLREAAKAASMGYYDHLAAGGKGDPAEERWIEALAAGADAITQVSVLEQRLVQAEEALAFERTYREDQAVAWELKCSLLERETEQAERERDAAVEDLSLALDGVDQMNNDCRFCKHNDKPLCETCEWEWRGVCEENSKEENHG